MIRPTNSEFCHSVGFFCPWLRFAYPVQQLKDYWLITQEQNIDLNFVYSTIMHILQPDENKNRLFYNYRNSCYVYFTFQLQRKTHI